MNLILTSIRDMVLELVVGRSRSTSYANDQVTSLNLKMNPGLSALVGKLRIASKGSPKAGIGCGGEKRGIEVGEKLRWTPRQRNVESVTRRSNPVTMNLVLFQPGTPWLQLLWLVA